ncbi:hypothetical protein M433DRAFT_160857 [Acidomyces richmondensis BFW]|nr:hypothetical protein M433DRAFT_160857 [Acidomyces richmondensis BFW]
MESIYEHSSYTRADDSKAHLVKMNLRLETTHRKEFGESAYPLPSRPSTVAPIAVKTVKRYRSTLTSCLESNWKSDWKITNTECLGYSRREYIRLDNFLCS